MTVTTATTVSESHSMLSGWTGDPPRPRHRFANSPRSGIITRRQTRVTTVTDRTDAPKKIARSAAASSPGRFSARARPSPRITNTGVVITTNTTVLRTAPRKIGSRQSSM